MIEPQKYRFVFHVVEGGVELSISLRGVEKRQSAINFISGLLNIDFGEVHSGSNNPEEHFIVSQEQLAVIQEFMKHKS